MPATISFAKGSTGSAVSTWQELLTKAGFPVSVTGTFDGATDGATRAWQKSKGLVADGIVGPASWSAMTGVSSAAPDPNASFGRDALLAAWPGVTGEQPSLAELQIAGAQAHLESNYGKASYKLLDHATGQTIASSGVIHNWGAVQTSSGPPEGFLATDTSPTKITADNPKGYYDHHYKVYPTPAAGAAHLIEHMTKKRPTSWAHMKAGDIDAWAEQMWAGKLPNGSLNKDPQTGMLGYFEQSPAARAKGIEQRIAAIAAALGEPIAAKRGGPMPTNAQGEPVPLPFDPGGGIATHLPTLPAGMAKKAGLAAALFAVLSYIAYKLIGPK